MLSHEYSILSDKTLIPISLVSIFIGFVFWLTGIYFESKANTQAIAEVKIEQRIYSDKLDDIIKKLSKIEGKLDQSIYVRK